MITARLRFVPLTLLLVVASGVPVAAQSRNTGEEARLLRQAAALESRGDFTGAEAALRRLLEADPASSGGLFALERVLRAMGETERILPVVGAFLEKDPTSSGVRYLGLRVLAEVDSLAALEREAERWIALDPGSEVPYREIARVYERVFGPEDALTMLERARSDTARGDVLALEIGDLHAAMGDLDAAVDEWVLAVGDDGAQAAPVARRIRGLTRGSADAGRRTVAALADSDALGRRRAGVRVAVEVGLEEEALDLAREVASDLDGRSRSGFLGEVARRARELELPELASWAYTELGEGADSPAERRQFDQNVVDVALANGDTATALQAQRRVAESYTRGSVDRRRATAQVIRLESGRSGPARLGELLRAFRDEFPNAPELDDLAATVASGLQARGDVTGAAQVLQGIEGPQSSLERAFLLLDSGDLEGGRTALLLSISGLDPADATDVIQLAGLMGRLSQPAVGLLAAAHVEARKGRGAEGARALMDAVHAAPEEERATLLAEAARIAQRASSEAVAAEIRQKVVDEFPEAPEFGEAALGLARYRGRTPQGREAAIEMLEELIAARPNAAIVPYARLELERLRERGR